MKVKRFFAPDMRQAIRKVRDEQGPDAVILSNRQVEGGIEIIAAVDYDASLFEQQPAADPTELPAVADAAADFLEGRSVSPDDMERARAEGWIWAPKGIGAV